MAALLIAISWRSLVLAAVAGLAMGRRRSAAARHAVWTLVTAGMLALGIGIATLPAIPVRVIKPAVRTAAEIPVFPGAVRVVRTAVTAPVRVFPWQMLIGAVYAFGVAAFAGRLAYGYRHTRNLARGSLRIERFEDAVYESESVVAPLTMGWLRPKILLPAGWERWSPEKLDAVLIHERNHVRRGDWAIAVLAGVNRCVFWFHPLAWWLEARLKVLAEEACDDASLPLVASRDLYAEVLVEIAAALRGGRRVADDAVGMAKGAEVGMRVERILDANRQIGPAMTRGRWALLVCCAAPVMYLAAVIRPARVQAQGPPAPVQPALSVPPAVEDGARAELDAEIAKFKFENMGRLPEQFQANVAQLNMLQIMLGQTNEALSRLQQERLMLETQLQNLNREARFNASVDPQARKMADDRTLQVKAQLAVLQETLAPQHPSVKRLEQELAVLEGRRGAVDQKEALELENSANLLKTEIQNLNLQMEEKVKQAAEIQRQIGVYQLRIENGPQLEARYAELLQRLRALTGNVQLSVTFGADGRPQKIEVIRGQGAEQDERAIEWAKGLRSGQTGPKVVTVEVPVNK